MKVIVQQAALQRATARVASAECRVRFPADVARQLHANGLKSAKGGIVDTAIIAGTNVSDSTNAEASASISVVAARARRRPTTASGCSSSAPIPFGRGRPIGRPRRLA